MPPMLKIYIIHFVSFHIDYIFIIIDESLLIMTDKLYWTDIPTNQWFKEK